MNTQDLLQNKNNKNKNNNNKNIIYLIVQILTPFLLFIVYMGSFFFVLQLPSTIPKIFSLERFGATGAILRLTYWSNLIMLIWIVFGTIVLCLLLILHCVRGNKCEKITQNQVNVLKGKLQLTIIFILFATFLSFAYVHHEKVIDIIKGYHSDMTLLKKNEIEIYEGKVQQGYSMEIAGGYYDDKPTPLRTLHSYDSAMWEEGQIFLCPNTLLKDIDIEENKLYRIYFLPYSKIVVSIKEYITEL